MMTLLRKVSRLAAILPLPVGLFVLALPPSSVYANSDWNQFDVCIQEMAIHGVSRDKAATACADALIPKELSECVSMIYAATRIPGEKVMLACYQVRRPIDLGNCVADVYNGIPAISRSEANSEAKESTLLSLLNSCRLSLRPGFYSECVIATSRGVPDMTPVKALDTCLAAEDFPRDLFPSYEQ
ncbi:hypothetical protein [Aphanothece sacrum]|uniref:Uncharacterized protein n=1 Tax=Aphanothece sacrum FPU1 TaxID=1920663 RepID=A0A401INE9_APHSA|nr:hypothetical protein [Aphanothece sacrum]GBF82794.1 hypothetical protein AsFPU1_4228 [Aphanothece sacrum FPU1]